MFIDDQGDTTSPQKNRRLATELLATYLGTDIQSIERVETPPTGWDIIPSGQALTNTALPDAKGLNVKKPKTASKKTPPKKRGG